MSYSCDFLVRTINVTPLLGSNVGKGMLSLQLQQYNALPADYIRPSNIILSRLCFPGSCLKNPAYQCINWSPPRQGVACRPGLSWRRPKLINNTIAAFFLYHVPCYRYHVWLLREGVVIPKPSPPEFCRNQKKSTISQK